MAADNCSNSVCSSLFVQYFTIQAEIDTVGHVAMCIRTVATYSSKEIAVSITFIDFLFSVSVTPPYYVHVLQEIAAEPIQKLIDLVLRAGHAASAPLPFVVL
jgi:hypothetical protein